MVDHLTYREQGLVDLAHACEQLAVGDLHQASEKGWGAASQFIKAAADHYGWLHFSHRQLYVAATNLYEVTGDDAFPKLFSSANSLHVNFYESHLNTSAVGQFLDDVARFVDKVDALLPSG